MHAYLLISKNRGLMIQKAQELAQMVSGTLTPFTLQKIADVKELSKLTRLTLAKTTFFIENIDEATIDALNAFLKQLEEPGQNVSFILTAQSEDKVLATIVSRCEVIRIRNQESGIKHTHKEPNTFLDMSTGEQFTHIDTIRKRDEAIEFMQELLETMHQELIRHPSSVMSLRLTEAQQTLTALTKNGNVTSQLSRFVVAIRRNTEYN